MLRNKLYYTLKPFLHRDIRYFVRRLIARQIRRNNRTTWPIDESSCKTPHGWPGWPGNKDFAFVLTHDVEGPEGLAKCRQIAEVEMEYGFRSTFNFIPEGPYKVPVDLRNWLTNNGFEVGVHDLEHNGLLLSSHNGFLSKARRINHYLREWNAVGFRAGFMLNNLNWYQSLDILYDASTFDTDPFEPDPQGMHTIFPLWIPKPLQHNSDPSTIEKHKAESGKIADGYVELPYTLPQDSTLFLLLQEKSPEIWLSKLEWISKHKGMALVGVHPDYVQFEDERSSRNTYPVSHYRRLLNFVRTEYAGVYWHPLACELARFALLNKPSITKSKVLPPKTRLNPRRKIWIDLENTPHIPFFSPIIRELKKRGYEVVLSARDAYQTCEMADLYNFKYAKIGRHFGQKIAFKAIGLGIRSAQLIPFALKERPQLSLNHGSRSQVLASNLLRIPSVTIMDYEHTRGTCIGSPRWMIVPKTVNEGAMGTGHTTKLRHYSGIKEDVYAPELAPDPSILGMLGLNNIDDIIVTVRPPATEAHYHNPESDVLFSHFMEHAVKIANVKIVLLPRNKRQEIAIKSTWPQWFSNNKIVIPNQVVDGLNLVWHSDLVVSGGGTMNREAAALGVPVYSIFRGMIGAVDHQLQSEGRLTLIETVADVEKLIILKQRNKSGLPDASIRPAMTDILNHIDSIFSEECSL